MKVTLFTTDESCTELIAVQATHVSMFDNNLSLAIHFGDKEEQLRLIEVCIKQYTLIQIQGSVIKLVPEGNNFQRVRYRFD